MPRSHPKLTSARIKALKAMARKIDSTEADEIKAHGRQAFTAHERLVGIVDELRRERKRKQMSLSRVSLLTGIAKPNLSRLERNAGITPTLDTLSRYAHALGKVIDIRLLSGPSR